MGKINLVSNIYDTLGYILPGLTIFSVGYYLITNNFTINLNLFNSGLILAISYVSGHLLQSLANIIEDSFLRKCEKLRWLSGFPEANFLSKESYYYSPSLKRKIRRAAIKYFGLDRNINEHEIQKLCQSLLIQKGLNSNIEKFGAIYGFYRGFIVSMLLSSIAFLTKYLTQKSSFALTLTAITFIATMLFWRRYSRFGKIFADYVFRDFYVFYQGLRNMSDLVK